ncbi:hypothetical protein RCL1_001551 [Eukaryota sp. TZLM3-RCL]
MSKLWVTRLVVLSTIVLFTALARSSSPRILLANEESSCENPMSHADPCAYVRENCADTITHFGFSWLELHACFFHKLSPSFLFSGISLVILILAALLLFSLLGSTADSFLAPALTELGDILKLSPEIAGCTLLSFANASPDVFSILAGSEVDIMYAVGEALGSSLFAVSLIFALVTYAVGEFKVNKGPFMRDAMVYFVGVLVFFAFILQGKLYLWQMIIVLAYYVLYILYLVVSELIVNLKLKKQGLLSSKSLKSVVQTDEKLPILPVNSFEEFGARLIDGNDEKTAFKVILDSLEWSEKSSILSKMIGVVEFPFGFIRFFTIIPFEEAKSFKIHAILTPFFSSIFFFWCTDLFTFEPFFCGISGVYLSIGLGILLSLITFILIKKESVLPNPKLFWLVISICCSVVWLHFIADELVFVLQSISLIIGIPPILIGLVVLSIGNGIGDLVANLVVAKAGNPVMSTAACYSSSLLSMNLGLSLAFIPELIKKPIEIHVDPNLIVTFVFLVISLVTTLILVPIKKFKCTKLFAHIQLVVYILFIVCATLFGIGVLKPFW